jgi:hypothetical protein
MIRNKAHIELKMSFKLRLNELKTESRAQTRVICSSKQNENELQLRGY